MRRSQSNLTRAYFPIHTRMGLGRTILLLSAVVTLMPTQLWGAYQPAVLLAANNLTDVANAATAWINLGGGTAGKKAASDNSKTTVASVTGSFTAGHGACLADTSGTINDCGAAPGTGTMATQNADNVAITGGAIDGTPIGSTTRAAVKGTTGDFNGILTTGSGRVRALRVVIAAGAITGATTDDVVVVNKTSGAATAYNAFGSPATGVCVQIKDGKGDAASNPITFTPAAGNVDGAATFVMNQNYQAATFCYNATQWNVF